MTGIVVTPKTPRGEEKIRSMMSFVYIKAASKAYTISVFEEPYRVSIIPKSQLALIDYATMKKTVELSLKEEGLGKEDFTITRAA